MLTLKLSTGGDSWVTPCDYLIGDYFLEVRRRRGGNEEIGGEIVLREFIRINSNTRTIFPVWPTK